MTKDTFDDLLSDDVRAENGNAKAPATLGGYTLLREIGAGGMGTVYEATQEALKRRVALKILLPHLSMNSKAIQRFVREGEAAGRQQHPNIVAIYDVGQDNGVHYIVQELIEGGRSLKERLDEWRNIPELPADHYRQLVSLFIKCTNALQHAHDGGVVHRDIKPSNILLMPDGEPKVSDFGLALVEDALSLSRTGQQAGTPYYMSPEQVVSRRISVDNRSDIFSLGVTLYEALTFSLAFAGDTSQQVIEKILLDDPLDPRKLRSRVPPELSAICLKAMEKKKEHRYQSMTEFGADLQRFVDDKPILARPPSPLRHAIKWTRRHPVWTISGTILLVTFCVVSGLLVLLDRKSTELAEEIETSEAALEFMVGLFESSDPYKSHGEETTVRSVLDQSRDSIASSFEGQPEVRSRLITTIAQVYTNLEQPEHAIPLLEESLAIQKEQDLVQTANYLANKRALGLNYRAIGRYDKAEQLLLENLDLFRNRDGPNHLNTIDTMGHLANLYINMGRLEEAESLLLTVIKVLTPIVGDMDPRIIGFQKNLGGLYFYMGQLEEAEALMTLSLEKERQILPEGALDITISMGHLANLYVRVGKNSEAESLLIEVIERKQKHYGAESRSVFEAMGLMGVIYANLDKTTLAEQTYLDAIAGLSQIAADTDPGLMGMKFNLAIFYGGQGRLRESIALNRHLLQQRTAVLGDTHPDTLSSLNNLIYDLVDNEQYSEAHPLAKQLLKNTKEESPRFKDRQEMLDNIENQINN